MDVRPAILAAALLFSVATGSAASFEATFSPKPGNEWWVETEVSANQPLAGVDARVDGGGWITLEKRSWGAWAKSFHVEDGSHIEFRARATDGSTVMSQAYVWPEATPASNEGFAATFSPKPGNEWWVETDVSANQPLAGVDARDDGGAWIALEKRSWGAWAKSFRVEDGSHIEFRARATDGSTVMSQAYVWPEAEPVEGEPGPDPDPDPEPEPEPGPVDVAFGPKAGNAWWVETYVVANDTVTDVEARSGTGAWHTLTLRDWGTWAGSFHAGSGIVEFRATTPNGTDTSIGFQWPGATVAGGDGTWPEEGSYAYNAVSTSNPAPGHEEGHLTLIRHDDAWWSLYETRGELAGSPVHTVRFDDQARLPTGPTDVQPGDRVQVGDYEVIVQHREPYPTHQDGGAVTAETWYGERTDACNCLGWDANWHTGMGLAMHLHQAGRGSYVQDLVDTDAPIG